MGVRAICVALLLSSLPVAGCGTAANLITPGPEQGGKLPFGGVKRDVTCIEKARNADSDVGPHPESEPDKHTQTAALLFSAADLPFSFIGDVITWPYTAGYTWVNQPVPVPPQTQAAGEGPHQIQWAPQDKETENKDSENKDSEKKTPDKDGDKGKAKDDKPAQLPMPLSQPKGMTP